MNFLNKNKIIIKRKDNLPRLAYNNNIDMKKLKRDGKSRFVPTIYKIPTSNQIKAMLDGMKNNNNSLLEEKF